MGNKKWPQQRMTMQERIKPSNSDRRIRLETDIIETKMLDEERRAIVWGLRLQGFSYERISNYMTSKYPPFMLPKGYNAKSAYADCSAVLNQVRNEYKETALEMVDIESNRFDAMLKGIWEQAEAGDLAAIDRVLAISRERRKMLGLDDPERLQIDWRVQVADMLQGGVIRPEDVMAQFGEEALIEVNQLLLERKDE